MVLASLFNHLSAYPFPHCALAIMGSSLYQAFVIVSGLFPLDYSHLLHTFTWTTHSHASDLCSNITFTKSLPQPSFFIYVKMSLSLLPVTSFSQDLPLLFISFVCLVCDQMKMESSLIHRCPSLPCPVYQPVTSISKMYSVNLSISTIKMLSSL